MEKRKLTANFVFSGREFLDTKTVLIFEGERLMDMVPYEEAGENIEFIEGTLLPGIINTHCHLELSHLKATIPRHTGLVNFVENVINERNGNGEIIDEAIKLANQQMWGNGIQAAGDICNTSQTIGVKRNSRIYYHSFIEVAGFPPAAANTRFDVAEQLSNEFLSNQLPASLTPHAPYSVSPLLFQKIDSSAGDGILSIHNQEVPDENKFFLKKEGDLLRMYHEMGININFFSATQKTSLQSWLPAIHKKKSLLLVHNVAINEDDITYIREWKIATGSNVYFAICARANEYISAAIPPVYKMIESGMPITIGTDSLASNDKLDLAYEINLLETQFPTIDISVWLHAACANGAAALGVEERLGNFFKQSSPGLVQMMGEAGQRNFKRII